MALCLRWMLLLIVLLAWPHRDAAALLMRTPSLEVGAADADFVVEAKILSVDAVEVAGDSCGSRYRARVAEVFKSKFPLAAGDTIEFGRTQRLVPGRSYILFVRYVSDPQAVYDNAVQLHPDLAAYDDRDKTMAIIACQGLVPGYEFESLLHLEVRADTVYQSGFAPPPLPDTVPVIGSTGFDHLFAKEPFLAHLREIANAPRRPIMPRIDPPQTESSLTAPIEPTPMEPVPPAALAQIGEIEQLRFTVIERLPDGLPLQVRPTAPLAIEGGSVGGGAATYISGTVGVEQLGSDRRRVTFRVSHLKQHVGSWTGETTLPDVLLTRSEVDASGKHLVIGPRWADLPERSPSSQLAQPLWSLLRAGFLHRARDWPSVLEDYEDALVYRSDFTIGSLIGPSNLDELLATRLEQVEAMVRGNEVGFWADLPRGTLTAVQRQELAAAIRDKAMPAAYERDLRIRGNATYAGRSFLLASGTLRKTHKSGTTFEGTLDVLFDPATGLVGLSRTRLTNLSTGEVESSYSKIGLP
jgi:hypothetical protein